MKQETALLHRLLFGGFLIAYLLGYLAPAEPILEQHHKVAYVSGPISTYFVIAPDKSLVGWGLNDCHRLGGHTDGLMQYIPRLYPFRKTFLQNVEEVWADYNAKSVIALDGDGVLWGWGVGRHLLRSDTIAYEPRKLMEDVAHAAVWGSQIAVVKRDGTLWGWGRNYGRIFYPEIDSMGYSWEPVKLMDDVEKTLICRDIMFAIQKNHDLYAWGNLLDINPDCPELYKPNYIASNVNDVAEIDKTLYFLTTADGQLLLLKFPSVADGCNFYTDAVVTSDFTAYAVNPAWYERCCKTFVEHGIVSVKLVEQWDITIPLPLCYMSTTFRTLVLAEVFVFWIAVPILIKIFPSRKPFRTKAVQQCKKIPEDGG